MISYKGIKIMSFVRAHGNFERRDNVKADENMVLSPLHFHCNYTIVLKCVRAFIYNDYSFSLANVAVSSIQSTPSLTLYGSMSAVVSSPIHISASENKLQSFPFCRCIVLLMSKFYHRRHKLSLRTTQGTQFAYRFMRICMGFSTR